MSTVSMRRPERLKLRTNAGNRYRRRKAPTGQSAAWRATKLFFFCGVLSCFLAVVGLGLLWGYRWLTVNPYFGLEAISVQGNERLSRGEILQAAGVGPGVNCLGTNVEEVQTALSSNPWISRAAVRRELPDKLFIKIEERSPIFWVRKDGVLQYADAEGRIIAPVSPEHFASLPVLSVEEGAVDRLAVLPALVRAMRAGELPFGLGQTAWIKLTSTQEMEIRLDEPALTIRFELDDWDNKIRRLAHVWDDMKRRGEFAEVTSITARGDRVWVERRSS